MCSLPPDDDSVAGPEAPPGTAVNTQLRRRRWVPSRHAAAAAVCAGALTVGALYVTDTPSGPAAASSEPSSPVGSTGQAPVPPLHVLRSSPAASSTGVDGTTAVTITTDQPVDVTGPLPGVEPPTAGSWSANGDQLVFTPTGAFSPDSTIRVSVPAGLRSRDGSVLGRPWTLSFRTSGGSVLALQEDLASLGYLPLRFVPASPPDDSPAGRERAVYHPVAGQFSWTWRSVPPTLSAVWSPGQETVMLRGAVMAFEAAHGLSVDGVAGPQVWHALLGRPANTHGYTYAVASKSVPETLTVWHDGQIISTSRANTGIAQAPTADGTFPVYERLAKQVMRGTNPDGTRYADPVAWVAYFNGGDAIHYMGRSSYGSPQSLGCVEVRYHVGETIWPYLTLGTLVTVTP